MPTRLLRTSRAQLLGQRTFSTSDAGVAVALRTAGPRMDLRQLLSPAVSARHDLNRELRPDFDDATAVLTSKPHPSPRCHLTLPAG